MSTIEFLDQMIERQTKRKRELGMDTCIPTEWNRALKTHTKVGMDSVRLYYAQQEWAMRHDEGDAINQRDRHLVRQNMAFDELLEMVAGLASTRVNSMLMDLKAENMAILGVEKEKENKN